MQDAYAYCAELVRTAARDRFIATLFAPAEQRGALHARLPLHSLPRWSTMGSRARR
jgi:hypothetical protein